MSLDLRGNRRVINTDRVCHKNRNFVFKSNEKTLVGFSMSWCDEIFPLRILLRLLCKKQSRDKQGQNQEDQLRSSSSFYVMHSIFLIITQYLNDFYWVKCVLGETVQYLSKLSKFLQERILEWVAIPFSRSSSLSRDRTQVSCIGRQILYHLSHQAKE